MAKKTNKTKKAPAESWRSDTEILKELIDEILEYNALRDDEVELMADNGDPELWDSGTVDTHDELVGEIQAHRGIIQNLIREATGDNKIEF